MELESIGKEEDSAIPVMTDGFSSHWTESGSGSEVHKDVEGPELGVVDTEREQEKAATEEAVSVSHVAHVAHTDAKGAVDDSHEGPSCN